MIKRIICICILCSFIISIGSTAFAKSTYINSDNPTKVTLNSFFENVTIIEDYIESQGTTVLKELNKEKERLNMLLNSEVVIDNRANLEGLIKCYSNMIVEYNDYQNSRIIEPNNIDPYGVDHPILSPAVATIVSFFLTMRYYLAAELLTYAKEDAVLNEYYYPVFGVYVYDTAEYDRLVDEISNVISGNGTSSFLKGGIVKDNDLYYALHRYNYAFNYSSLTITDYYDYQVNSDYQGIAGTAINTMYMAQVLGVIVPYYVRINITR